MSRVHRMIYREVDPWGTLWGFVCDFEAWNGAQYSENWDEVTCDDCLRHKPKVKGKK